MSNRMPVWLQLFLVATSTATLALASAPNGKLLFFGTVAISGTDIDFVPPLGSGEGSIVLSPGQNTGDFAIFNGASTSGTIRDLSVSAQPVGVPISFSDWLTIPGFTFTLEFILRGVANSEQCFAPPAGGQMCTPTGSPFTFVNLSSNASITSFSVSGTGTNAATGEASPFEGIFTMQVSMPYQSLFSVISASGSVTTSFSAQLTALGASEQSIRLIEYVNSLLLDSGTKTSLLSKLNVAASAISQDRPSACGQLGAFISEVMAQAGNMIPMDQAQQMIAAAQQIRAVLGCR